MAIHFDPAQFLRVTGDAVVAADADGAIVFWNAAAGRIFGYAEAEALGRSLDLIIPPHLRNAHWAGFDAAIHTGQLKLNGKPTLTRALHKTGRKLYVEMSFALVEADQGVLGSVAVARDVTERIERERAGAAR